jgi:predicted DNA-binding WGR domain protein
MNGTLYKELNLGKCMVVILPSKRPIYWENKSEEHNKFWAADIQEDKKGNITSYILVRRWGLIGTIGQRMELIFQDKYDAERELERLISDKERKGYRPVF